MSRPMERLNWLLTQLCLRTGTFHDIPNLQDGNLWYATEAQLADSVHRAILMLNPLQVHQINSKLITEVDFMRSIRVWETDVQTLEGLRVYFTPKEARILLSQDIADGFAPGEGNAMLGVPIRGDCSICMEEDVFIRTLETCECLYCYGCLRTLIRTHLGNDNMFPPSCCHRDLRPVDILKANRPSLYHLYLQKLEESKCHPLQRIYCADLQCGTFIAQQQPPVGRVVTTLECGYCAHFTCANCHEQDHPGKPCVFQPNCLNVWDMMDEVGAVNCPGCGDICAHGGGCNTMSCKRCFLNYCFICGEEKLGLGDCDCPDVGSHELRIPIAARPGVKPAPFKPQAIRTQPAEDMEQRPPLMSEGVRTMHHEETSVELRMKALFWRPNAYAAY